MSWFIIILVYLLIVGIAIVAMYMDMGYGQTVENYINNELKRGDNGMCPWYIMALIPVVDLVAFFPLFILLVYKSRRFMGV